VRWQCHLRQSVRPVLSVPEAVCAAATQVAACFFLVAATDASLYFLLVVIIPIIRSLLNLLYELQTVVLLNIV